MATRDDRETAGGAPRGAPAARAGAAGALLSLLFSLAYVLAQLAEWLGWLGSGGGPHATSTAAGLGWLLIPSLLLGPAFLLLVAGLSAVAPPARRPYALMSLACAAIYAALTGSVYFVQLTIVAPRLAAGGALGPFEVLRFTPFVSPLYAVDILGYAFMSLSAGFAAAALPGVPETRAARLALTAVACVLPFLIGQMVWPVLIWPAASWGVSFPLAAAAMVHLFLRTGGRGMGAQASRGPASLGMSPAADPEAPAEIR